MTIAITVVAVAGKGRPCQLVQSPDFHPESSLSQGVGNEDELLQHCSSRRDLLPSKARYTSRHEALPIPSQSNNERHSAQTTSTLFQRLPQRLEHFSRMPRFANLERFQNLLLVKKKRCFQSKFPLTQVSADKIVLPQAFPIFQTEFGFRCFKCKSSQDLQRKEC